MRVLQAPSQWPPWAVMWLLASCIYATCKWLTWRCADAHRVPPWKHAAYLLAWPGMDAGAFLAKPMTPPSSTLARGLCWYFAVFWGVRLLLQGVFDVSEQLTTWWIRTGYHALTALFIGLTVIYTVAALGVAT